MRYELKIIADHDMTEDEALNVIDVLNDTHDSASVRPRIIDVDGSFPRGLLGSKADLIVVKSRLRARGYETTGQIIE